MPYKNPEDARAYGKRHYQEHREEIRLRHKKTYKIYYKNNKEKLLQKCKQWKENNADWWNTYNENYRDNNREIILLKKKISDFVNRDILSSKRLFKYIIDRFDVLSYYSNNKLYCKVCKINYYNVLTIDHINGGGCHHREELNIGDFYSWLRRMCYPEGYEVLCHNCNSAKDLEPIIDGTPKFIVFMHYNNNKLICKCHEHRTQCLSLNHIRGRRNGYNENHRSGNALYEDIIRNNFPEGYEVLCFNCNWLAHIKNIKNKKKS